MVTSHHYSAAHQSAANKKFVEAFQKANKNMRPNFMAVGGYDGMRVIYEGAQGHQGQGGGDALLAAMKGQIFESPRGQMLIDAQTRDIVQDVYLRKVEKKDGQLYNVEFDVHQGGEGPGQDASKRTITLSSSRLGVAAAGSLSVATARLTMLTLLFDGIAYGMLLFVLARRAGRDAGADELHQPRARRLRDGRRLRRGAADAAAPAGRSWPACRWPSSSPPPLGALLERTLYRPMYGKPHLDQVLFSIGLAFMAVAAVDYFIGSSAAERAVARVAARPLRDRQRRPAAGHGRTTACSSSSVCVALALVLQAILAARASAAGCAPRSTTRAWPPASASTSTACSC